MKSAGPTAALQKNTHAKNTSLESPRIIVPRLLWGISSGDIKEQTIFGPLTFEFGAQSHFSTCPGSLHSTCLCQEAWTTDSYPLTFSIKRKEMLSEPYPSPGVLPFCTHIQDHTARMWDSQFEDILEPHWEGWSLSETTTTVKKHCCWHCPRQWERSVDKCHSFLASKIKPTEAHSALLPTSLQWGPVAYISLVAFSCLLSCP